MESRKTIGKINKLRVGFCFLKMITIDKVLVRLPREKRQNSNKNNQK